MSDTTNPSRARASRRRPARAFGLGVGSALALLVVLEFLFRWQSHRLLEDPAEIRAIRDYVVRGRVAGFESRPYYNFARPAHNGEFNSLGFLGPEWKLERTPGVPRILCMGGSTTECGNPDGYAGSYPYALGAFLEARLGRPVEVLNGAIASWTSAEMMCAWFTLFQDYRPDLVILHEVVNDVEPRVFPGFRPDYAHWRKAWEVPRFDPVTRWLVSNSALAAWVLLQRARPGIDDVVVRQRDGEFALQDGQLRPETRAPFERNVQTIGRAVHASGAQVLLATLPIEPLPIQATPQAQTGADSDALYRSGIAEHNQVFRDLAEREGWMLVDLSARMTSRPRADEVFLDLVHVLAIGNIWKAMQIGELLIENGWTEAASSE